jgi:hypothetical protein
MLAEELTPKDRARGQRPEERVFAWAARGRLRIDLQLAALVPARADVQRSAMARLAAIGEDLQACRRRAANSESVQTPDSGRGS